MYGAAVMFYEEVAKDKLTDSDKKELGIVSEEQCAEDVAEKNTDKTVHRNKCICLLSQWPFFDTFRKFLSYLYRISISGPHTVPIERYVIFLKMQNTLF